MITDKLRGRMGAMDDEIKLTIKDGWFTNIDGCFFVYGVTSTEIYNLNTSISYNSEDVNMPALPTDVEWQTKQICFNSKQRGKCSSFLF